MHENFQWIQLRKIYYMTCKLQYLVIACRCSMGLCGTHKKVQAVVDMF